jgi:hypothetical protein
MPGRRDGFFFLPEAKCVSGRYIRIVRATRLDGYVCPPATLPQERAMAANAGREEKIYA